MILSLLPIGLALLLGFGAGAWVATRRIPAILANMTPGQLTGLAHKVSAKRNEDAANGSMD